MALGVGPGEGLAAAFAVDSLTFGFGRATLGAGPASIVTSAPQRRCKTHSRPVQRGITVAEMNDKTTLNSARQRGPPTALSACM
jgi:hypothetical protein